MWFNLINDLDVTTKGFTRFVDLHKRPQQSILWKSHNPSLRERGGGAPWRIINRFWASAKQQKTELYYSLLPWTTMSFQIIQNCKTFYYPLIEQRLTFRRWRNSSSSSSSSTRQLLHNTATGFNHKLDCNQ